MVKQVEPLFLYKKFFKSLSYLTVGLLGCLGFCLYTHTGGIATLQLINDLTPYQIEYTEFSGYLAGQFQFKNLNITSDTLQIQSQQLSVDWQPLTLFQNVVHINDLKAKEFIIHSTAHFDAATSLPDNSMTLHKAAQKDIKLLQQDINQWLPFEVLIDNAAFYDGKVFIADQEQDIQILKLSSFDSTKIIRTQSVDYIGHYGFIHAKHDKKLHIHWNLTSPEPLANLYALSTVQTQGDVSLLIDDIDDDQDQIDIFFQAKSFKHNQYDLNDMLLKIKGSIPNHHIQVKAIANNKPIHMQVNGKWLGQIWEGTLEQAYIDDPQLKSMTKSHGKLTLDYKNNWQINADLKLLGQKITGNLTMFNQAPFVLEGEFSIHVQQLENLKSFIPALAKAQGRANGKIHINGTMANPILTGMAHIDKLTFPIPQYGVNAIFQSITIVKDRHQIQIDGSGVMSHGGTFEVKGTADIKPNLNLVLKLSGKNLIVSNTPEYYIVASPELSLTYVNNLPKLTGYIFVPKARINRLTQVNKSTRSSDIVIKSKSQRNSEKPTYRAIYQDLNIALGDDIYYKDSGLTSRITGQLHLKQKPNNIPTLNGKLNLIDGTYKFQSRVFELTYGQLHFTGGPMNKPLLDIEAKQRVLPTFAGKKSTMPTQPIEVGVKLTGEISEPKIHFFSTPTLSEADIMSYLVIGRPQSEASDSQTEMLFQAATQLSSMFGGKHKDFSLAQSLKLDHFELSKGDSSNSLEDTILTLGKQLSDRLYLNYSLGFLDSSNTFGLQYILGKNVHVAAQTGTTGSSADLVISFDSH